MYSDEIRVHVKLCETMVQLFPYLFQSVIVNSFCWHTVGTEGCSRCRSGFRSVRRDNQQKTNSAEKKEEELRLRCKNRMLHYYHV